MTDGEWRRFYRPLMLKIMHVAMNLINTHILSFYSIIVAGDRNNFMQTLKLSVSLKKEKNVKTLDHLDNATCMVVG